MASGVGFSESESARRASERPARAAHRIELGWPDLIASLTLVLVAAIIALPALRAELLANSDNPVHLAEIRDLARGVGNGWSELGFCGFPLQMLQPPLTFGGLALLTRWGIPLEPLYQFALVASLIAPGLALYWVARRQLGAGLALILAVSLPLYRSSISGEASAFSGMFSFYFAASALLLLAAVLVRPSRTLKDFVEVAALAGFIGATHMYVTVALVYLGLVHSVWSLRNRVLTSRLYWDLPALALGALVAACYWLPNLLARTPAERLADPIGRVVIRFFTASAHSTATTPPGLLTRLSLDPVAHADSLLQIAMAVLIVLALRHAWRASDDLPRYCVSLGAVLVFAMCLRALTGVALLGPTGTRLLFVTKMALLVSCAPFLAEVTARFSKRAMLFASAAIGVGLSFVSQRVVAREILPRDNEDLTRVHAMWSWIKAHRSPSWGRIYVQDTFGAPIGNALDHSHLLVRTAELTGAEQIGAYYGLTPYWRPWLLVDTFAPGAYEPAIPALDRGNVTHLLIVNADTAQLTGEPLKELVRFGRYALLERPRTTSGWASVSHGAGSVSVLRREPGKISLSTSGAPAELLVSESFHPFWRAEPPASARIHSDSLGLMRVEKMTSADDLELVFAPPRLPKYLSLFGVSLIAGLAVLANLRVRRSATA